MKKSFLFLLVALITGFLPSPSVQAGFYYAAPSKKPVPPPSCLSGNSGKICQAKSLKAKPLSDPVLANKKQRAEKNKPAPLPLSPASPLPETRVSSHDVKEINLSASPVFQKAPLPVSQWQAIKGTTLRQVLEQWTRQASVDLEWGTEFDYPLLTSFRAEGAFEEALKKLLDAFSESTPRPYGRLHRNGDHSVLVIQTRGKTHYDQ